LTECHAFIPVARSCDNSDVERSEGHWSGTRAPHRPNTLRSLPHCRCTARTQEFQNHTIRRPALRHFRLVWGIDIFRGSKLRARGYSTGTVQPITLVILQHRGRSSTDAIAFPPDRRKTCFLVSGTNLVTSHPPPNAREIWTECRCCRSLLTLSSSSSGNLTPGISYESQWSVPLLTHLNITSDLITTLMVRDTDVHRPSRSHKSTPRLVGSIPELPTARPRPGALDSVNRAAFYRRSQILRHTPGQAALALG
jgi:hypothetical protein